MDRHAHKVHLRDLQVVRLIFAAKAMGRHSIFRAPPLAFRAQCTRIGGTSLHGLRFRRMMLRSKRDTLGALDHIGLPQFLCSTSAAIRRPGGFSTPTHSPTCLRVPRQHKHCCSLPSLAKPCPNQVWTSRSACTLLCGLFYAQTYVVNACFATSHFFLIACRSRTSIISFSNSMNVILIIIGF